MSCGDVARSCCHRVLWHDSVSERPGQQLAPTDGCLVMLPSISIRPCNQELATKSAQHASAAAGCNSCRRDTAVVHVQLTDCHRRVHSLHIALLYEHLQCFLAQGFDFTLLQRLTPLELLNPAIQLRLPSLQVYNTAMCRTVRYKDATLTRCVDQILVLRCMVRCKPPPKTLAADAGRAKALQ